MEVLSLSFSVGAPTYNERAGANMRKIMKRYAERVRYYDYYASIYTLTPRSLRIERPRSKCVKNYQQQQ